MQKTTQVQEKTQVERIKELYRPSLLQHYAVLHDFNSPEEYYENIQGIKSAEDFVEKYGLQTMLDLQSFYLGQGKRELCISTMMVDELENESIEESLAIEDGHRQALVIKLVPGQDLLIVFSLFE
jgi:hypothetical protein